MLRRSAILAQMMRNEFLPSGTLAARQDSGLRDLVRHAGSRVPFYRDLYAAHGMEAAAFGGLADLSALPIVDKAMLREAGAAAVSIDAPADRVAVSTSGSSGEPFEFPIDRPCDQRRKAQYLRPYLSNGRRLGDSVLRLTAFPKARFPWFSRLGLLRERQYDCGMDPARVAAAWRELEPQVLQGYPSSLRSLAHHCLERDRPLEPAPRRVFTDSELLTRGTRALLEQAFRAPVIDVFGTFETDNIAYQCPAGGGYHVATDCVVLEIVRDGKPAPPGAEGEIVVTVLANRTHPFIRYNLRDVGRLSPEPCSCGRSFPLLSSIEGRTDDMIVLADGSRRTAMNVLGRIDRFIGEIRHYQLRQVEVGRFELLIVPSSRFSDVGKEGIRRAAEAGLEGAGIEMRLLEAMPLDRSGKRRAFVSLLNDGGDA
ncbi:MAG: phenylacetate--CoA ligase family protein [Candidatus Deferrimicrobiaceae bacterium]